MRRCAVLMMAISALGGRAEVVDRIAASVAGQVVTLSDIRRQIRVSAFLEKTEPDYSAQNLRRTAEQLVDQVLIRREAELSRYQTPSYQEVEEELAQFAASSGMDRKEMFSGALKYGFSEQELRDQAAWQLTLTRFIDYRFRPGVVVSEADVANYYNNVFLPQFRARSPGEPPPVADAVRSRIIEILNTQLATEASYLWLEQARKQTRIRYFEEAF